MFIVSGGLATPRRATLSADDRYTLQSLYHTTPTIKPAPLTP